MNPITRIRELRECPFCGEKNISFNPPQEGYKGSINCPACLAFMPREVNDDEELIGSWNARTHDWPALEKLIAEMKDALIFADMRLKNFRGELIKWKAAGNACHIQTIEFTITEKKS